MPEITNAIDACIIGGGPAGSAAAIMLARAGASVVVIESKLFPRVKVCGEYISPAATEDIEDLLGTQRLLDAGAARVDRVTIEHAGHTWSWRTPIPAWVVSRASLDTLLLDQARDCGADVRSPLSVRSVEYFDDRVELSMVSGEILTARCVIHADGSGRLDPLGPTPIDRHVVGLKCHLRLDQPIEGLVMRPARRAYLGLVGIEDNLATCALVTRSELLRSHNADRDALLRSLWPSYQTQWRHGDWHACAVPRSQYRGTGHPRSVRIGNAGAAIDPVGGEGIGNGLWAGRLSGKLIVQWLSEGADPSGLIQLHMHIKTAYAHRLRTRLPACRLAAVTLMRPALATTVARIGSLPLARSATVLPWLALTGKPMRV